MRQDAPPTAVAPMASAAPPVTVAPPVVTPAPASSPMPATAQVFQAELGGNLGIQAGICRGEW